MQLKRYAVTTLTAARTHDYFGLANMLGNYLLRLFELVAMILIWTQLFNSGADTGGMTLPQLRRYTYLSTILFPLLDVRTPASNWLHEGTILSNYLRPMSIFGQLTAYTFASWLQPLAFFALPAALLAPLVGIDLRPESWLFWPSLALCVSQGFAIDYLFACLLIRLRNMTWTVHSIRAALAALLTGGVIPFAVLPFGIGDWLAYSPFGTLAGAPLSIAAGLGDGGMLILVQMLWNALLWPAALICFKRSRERMISYGG